MPRTSAPVTIEEKGSGRRRGTSGTSESPVDPNRRVLYVDDEPLTLRAVQRTLRDTNFTVDVANSAEQGLRMLEENSYALVAADYRMPGLDGIQFFERVRRTWPETIRVLVTGQGDFELALKAINRAGLFRFLTKPWDPSDLRNTFERACMQYRIVRDNHELTCLLEKKNTELIRVNERLDGEVQRRTSDLLVSLLNALDLRDTETQWHSRRVALYSRRLAIELGLDQKEVLDVERGALLHDLGKIGVSDTILLKPGKLTEAEWEEMRKHTVYGYNMLRNIDFLGNARLLVRNHHERHDGTGYPDRLTGPDIYIGARIFAVIDTYDAMTSDRPYRKALPPSVAHEEILKHRCAQFDPDCVDAFLSIPQEEIDELQQRASTDEGAGLD
jgi:putative nucleotidyltransferase with HDIG domain